MQSLTEYNLRAQDVARILSVSVKTVYRFARRDSGALPSLRVGAAYRFRLGDVEDWIRAEQKPHNGLPTARTRKARRAKRRAARVF